MAGEPNELPEGGEGGSGFGWGRVPGEWPAELPVAFGNRRIDLALAREVVQLRNRLHQIETAHFLEAVSGRLPLGVIGGPNELPEGGEGTGPILHWGGHWPGESPAELPIERLFGALEERFSALESQLQQLQEQVSAIRTKG